MRIFTDSMPEKPEKCPFHVDYVPYQYGCVVDSAIFENGKHPLYCTLTGERCDMADNNCSGLIVATLTVKT